MTDKKSREYSAQGVSERYRAWDDIPLVETEEDGSESPCGCLVTAQGTAVPGAAVSACDMAFKGRIQILQEDELPSHPQADLSRAKARDLALFDTEAQAEQAEQAISERTSGGTKLSGLPQ